jgi:DNA-directed RNA polymerase II subunit RPB7
VIDCLVDALDKNGFFGYFGPMRIFISKSSMTDDMAFQDTAFVSADGTQKVALGSEVRVRIVGVRRDGNNLYAIGTIDGDYLGPSLVQPLWAIAAN